MSLKFYEDGHKYVSLNGEDINWISVTSLIHKYTQPFGDRREKAEKCSKSKKKGNKWMGMDVDEILSAWENEAIRSQQLGTFYHNLREKAFLSVDTINYEGLTVPVIAPEYTQDGAKIAPPQKLSNGIYPEHMVYLKSKGVCGQSDLVEVLNGVLNIKDYKSNKEIKTTSFVNWEGISQKMKSPLAHLEDCNYNHYSLQLSMYMYMILKQNPQLKPGKLTIEHILFEKEGEDKYGYPIYKKDHEDNYIVTDIVPYDVPYLKDEVLSILNQL